jgi:hypothetical protein
MSDRPRSALLRLQALVVVVAALALSALGALAGRSRPRGSV